MYTKIVLLCINVGCLFTAPLGLWTIINVLAIIILLLAISFHSEMTGE